MAKEMLLDKLKRLSDAAWKRAERRYTPYDKKTDEAMRIAQAKKLGWLNLDKEKHFKNVILPEQNKLADAYEDASNFAERLENRYRSERAKRGFKELEPNIYGFEIEEKYNQNPVNEWLSIQKNRAKK